MNRKVALGSLAGAAVGAAVSAAALLGYQAGAREGGQAPVADSIANAPPAPAGPAAPPLSFAPILKRVYPAVVSIDTAAVGAQEAYPAGDFPFGFLPDAAPVVRRAAGSGFIISADGYVVTNNHVVDQAQEIVVTLSDQRQFRARLVGRDPPTDLAVLKIQATDLPFVSFAKAAVPAVGDWVIAVGNPFGLGGTATAGIVSAQAREIGEDYVSYMQIDAPINSGNSGGPSFDVQGRVVGVNTAIFTPSGGSVGIGFAIPADLAEDVSRQLIQTGRVVRGYLGVEVQDLTPALAGRLGVPGLSGAFIAGVGNRGPAAGVLRPGDIITGVDDQAITGASGLTRRIASAGPGAQLKLTLLRNGRREQVVVRTGERPSS